MFQSFFCFKEHRWLVQSTPSRLIGKAFQVKDCKYARSPNSNSGYDEMPQFLIFLLLCNYFLSKSTGLQVRAAPVDDDRGWAVWLARLPPTGGGLCYGSWRWCTCDNKGTMCPQVALAKHSFCSWWTESASHNAGKNILFNISISRNCDIIYQCSVCFHARQEILILIFIFKVILCLFPPAGGRGSLFFGGEVGKSRLFSHKGPHQDVLVNL